jgi:hypothetical protein
MSILPLEVRLTSEMEAIIAAVHCTNMNSYLEIDFQTMKLILFFAECKITP